MLVWLLVAMFVSGWLGCFARYAVDAETVKNTESVAKPLDWRALWSVFVLGAAAALVVPLFLSIGNNSIIEDILGPQTTGSVADEMLIVVGFCVLAGATAPTFIDSLAQKALSLAHKNAGKIEVLNEKADENLDLVTEQIEASDRSKPGAAPQAVKQPAELPNVGSDEKRVLAALNNAGFRRRSVSGIAKETHLGKNEVREILAHLIEAGHVSAMQSARTGVVLYELA
ncbi:YEATS-associated helix-containing protein [Aminobacter sp. HY435]|uniref:YEATS-associated helix-containing protein n=1 Tax=Aminobacter sp. HY435 TaxID=2970917 RepID=UPI0022B941EB|nr:YEATS-associated helix-containing protein [Aminobacter sp. HY435]